jgi:hypothetical protein
MALVRACLEHDFDASTQTCSQEVWLVQGAPWLLSVDDALLIGTSIAVLWTAAWVFRTLARQIRESG